MFPGIDGFHWTAAHVIFLSLFFAVVMTIMATVVSAVRRTARDFQTKRAIDFCWKADFAELPEPERRCRHELAGRVMSRTCDNAFDCRQCSKYSQFAVLPARGTVHSLGLDYPEDRFYHRGHTWVKREEGGILTVGLDALAEHVIGQADSIKMPAIDSNIEINETAWRMRKNGNEIRVRAPIEGKVVGVGGPTDGWYLKISPRLSAQDPALLRHLLRGPEVYGWVSRELERLQVELREPNTPPSLADGGVLMPGLMDAVPAADWDTVLAETFLEV